MLLTPYLISNAGKFNVVHVGDDGRLYSTNAHTPSLPQKATQWAKTHTVVYTRLRDAMRAAGLLGTSDSWPTLVSLYQGGQREHSIRANLRDEAGELLGPGGSEQAAVYLVYTPLAVEQDFARIQSVAAKSGVAVDPDVPYRISSAVAASLRIPLLDLRPVLARLKAEGQALTLPGDPHYSAPLSRAGAAAILDWLTAGRGHPAPQEEITR